MDAELARRLLRAVGRKAKPSSSRAVRQAPAGVSQPRKAGKAKGPWVTVSAEHLEVVRLTADEEQPGPRYVIESTITGRPERILGAGLLEGKVAPENSPTLDRWEVVEGRVRPVDAGRDPRLFERRERIDSPDGHPPQPNPPRVRGRAKPRTPRLWTGQPTEGNEV